MPTPSNNLTINSPSRRSLIGVNRQLIRDCAALFRDTRAWEKRPLRLVIGLIHRLNSLASQLPHAFLNNGLPRPSVTLIELEGLKAHAAAAATGSPALRNRICNLRDANSDSVYILCGLLHQDPEYAWKLRSEGSPSAFDILLGLSATDPNKVGSLIAQALKLRFEVQEGSGGSRNRPLPYATAIFETAENLYLRATGTSFLYGAAFVPREEVLRFHSLARLLFTHFRKIADPNDNRPVNDAAIRRMMERRYPDRSRTHRPDEEASQV